MLHSHVPYCRKSGVWPAGEEWLFEAMNETYIPFFCSQPRLRSMRISGFTTTISVSKNSFGQPRVFLTGVG
jgi:predicted glycosyl hydrolase (DUF1957 family)